MFVGDEDFLPLQCTQWIVECDNGTDEELCYNTIPQSYINIGRKSEMEISFKLILPSQLPYVPDLKI